MRSLQLVLKTPPEFEQMQRWQIIRQSGLQVICSFSYLHFVFIFPGYFLGPEHKTTDDGMLLTILTSAYNPACGRVFQAMGPLLFFSGTTKKSQFIYSSSYSLYLHASPRTLSAGYLMRLSAIFSATACGKSTSSLSASRIR